MDCIVQNKLQLRGRGANRKWDMTHEERKFVGVVSEKVGSAHEEKLVIERRQVTEMMRMICWREAEMLLA